MKNKEFIVLFMICWVAIIGFNMVQPNQVFSEQENRYLAQMPTFSMSDFVSGKYMQQVDTYIDDQFVQRNQWVSFKVSMERLLQKQEVNGVIFGEDDYLFEKHEQSKVDTQLAIKNLSVLNEFVNKYQSTQNIKVALVPTASHILVDKRSDLSLSNSYNQTEYLDDAFKQLGSDHWVDLRSSLSQHANESIYFRSDHHWSTLGAYYGYQSWITSLYETAHPLDDYDIELFSDTFYGTLHSKVNTTMKPDTLELFHLKEQKPINVTINYDTTSDSLYDRGFIDKKDKYAVFLGGNHAMVEIKTTNQNNKNLLVVKDSFANAMIPFMVDHFENIYVVDLRYYNGSIEILMEDYDITDSLLLYNVMGFVEDTNISKLRY